MGWTAIQAACKQCPALTRNPDRQKVKPVPISAKPSCDCLARHAPRRPIVGPSSCFQGPMKPFRPPARQARAPAVAIPRRLSSAGRADILQQAPERPQRPAGWLEGRLAIMRGTTVNKRGPQTGGGLKRSKRSGGQIARIAVHATTAVSAIPKTPLHSSPQVEWSRPQGSPDSLPLWCVACQPVRSWRWVKHARHAATHCHGAWGQHRPHGPSTSIR